MWVAAKVIHIELGSRSGKRLYLIRDSYGFEERWTRAKVEKCRAIGALRKLAEFEDQELDVAPAVERALDPLLGVPVAMLSGWSMVGGHVKDINIGRRSGERFYKIFFNQWDHWSNSYCGWLGTGEEDLDWVRYHTRQTVEEFHVFNRLLEKPRKTLSEMLPDVPQVDWLPTKEIFIKEYGDLYHALVLEHAPRSGPPPSPPRIETLPLGPLNFLYRQLRLLRGQGGEAQHIAPGGATHLCADTVAPWFKELPRAVQGCYWWVDLFACDDDRAAPAYLHNGTVHGAACARCRNLWSGLASVVDKWWWHAGNPRYKVERVADTSTQLIRFKVDAQIREPGTGLWRLPQPSSNERPPSSNFEFRIAAIRRKSMQVVLHADSRRAFAEGSRRIFASRQEGCALEFSVTAAEDADGDGCVVRTVDLRPLQGTFPAPQPLLHGVLL